jgi:hypothetical protein
LGLREGCQEIRGGNRDTADQLFTPDAMSELPPRDRERLEEQILTTDGWHVIVRDEPGEFVELGSSLRYAEPYDSYGDVLDAGRRLTLSYGDAHIWLLHREGGHLVATEPFHPPQG